MCENIDIHETSLPEGILQFMKHGVYIIQAKAWRGVQSYENFIGFESQSIHLGGGIIAYGNVEGETPTGKSMGACSKS